MYDIFAYSEHCEKIWVASIRIRRRNLQQNENICRNDVRYCHVIDFILKGLIFKCENVRVEFYSGYESDKCHAGEREYARDSAAYDFQEAHQLNRCYPCSAEYRQMHGAVRHKDSCADFCCFLGLRHTVTSSRARCEDRTPPHLCQCTHH